MEPILTASVSAGDTPARQYLAQRRVWPPTGPDLPDSVRWLPREAAPVKLPLGAAGALVFELTRADTEEITALRLETLTARGERVGWKQGSRWRPSYGPTRGTVFEPVYRDGGSLWLVEGECDALALAICGYGGLVRSAGSAGNLQLATVTDWQHRPIVLVADSDPKGRMAAWRLCDQIAEIGPERKPRVLALESGDPADLLAELLDPASPDWEGLQVAAKHNRDLLNLEGRSNAGTALGPLVQKGRT